MCKEAEEEEEEVIYALVNEKYHFYHIRRSFY